MIKLDIKGIDRTKTMLEKASKGIKVGSQKALDQISTLGYEYVMNIAPEYSGATKAGILTFKENPESWLIVSNAPTDNPLNFPTNVAFEKATTEAFGNMTMWGQGRIRIPFAPRTQQSIGFWSKTVEFLKTKFEEDFGLIIQREMK